MGKSRDTLVFAAVGVTGGIYGISSSANGCTGGACTACLRCAGMGLVLVVMAILKAKKGGKSDGLAERGN